MGFWRLWARRDDDQPSEWASPEPKSQEEQQERRDKEAIFFRKLDAPGKHENKAIGLGFQGV